MCHEFVGGPAGCWCLARMKLLIRGRRGRRRRKKTNKLQTDIPVAVGNKTEAETWGDIAGAVSSVSGRRPASDLWPEPPSGRFWWFRSLERKGKTRVVKTKTSQQQWNLEIHHTALFNRLRSWLMMLLYETIHFRKKIFTKGVFTGQQKQNLLTHEITSHDKTRKI